MPIEHWLRELPQHDHSNVDGDLHALASRPHPFLSDQAACGQIERLSAHLGRLKGETRRHVIAYSLYIRQMDVILESGPRATCAGDCPRPPAGCCNHDHFVILNMTDLMSSRGSPQALHMAHVIGQMQKLESAHNLGQGRIIRPGFCACLAEDGCTLRLFKSPRCAHYLCEKLELVMRADHGARADAFLAAMTRTVTSTISSPLEFTSGEAISAGALLYPGSLANA